MTMDLMPDDDGEIHQFGPEDWHLRGWMKSVAIPVGEECHLCHTKINEADYGVILIYVGEITTRVVEHKVCFQNSMGLA